MIVHKAHLCYVQIVTDMINQFITYIIINTKMMFTQSEKINILILKVIEIWVLTSLRKECSSLSKMSIVSSFPVKTIKMHVNTALIHT